MILGSADSQRVTQRADELGEEDDSKETNIAVALPPTRVIRQKGNIA
jgi:hypothetical protein